MSPVPSQSPVHPRKPRSPSLPRSPVSHRAVPPSPLRGGVAAPLLPLRTCSPGAGGLWEQGHQGTTARQNPRRREHASDSLPRPALLLPWQKAAPAHFQAGRQFPAVLTVRLPCKLVFDQWCCRMGWRRLSPALSSAGGSQVSRAVKGSVPSPTWLLSMIRTCRTCCFGFF